MTKFVYNNYEAANEFFLLKITTSFFFPIPSRVIGNFPCKKRFFRFFGKFPVFSLSGKMDFQIPCFPYAVTTLILIYTT